MSTAGPSVLLMARVPRPGHVRRRLTPTLGEAGAAALGAQLIRDAAGWAHAVAPGRAFVGHDPAEDPAALRPLVGEVTMIGSATVVDAVAEVLQAAPAPLLVVWPELAVWRPGSAEGAVADLHDGCDLVLGPLIEGGFYLLAVNRPLSGALAAAEHDWRVEDAMQRGFATAQEAGLELGLLRTERGLRRAADVRAALADPCLPAVIRQLLSRPGV